MTQKLICMSEQELLRYDVIKNLLNGQINGTDASKQIGVSIRHVKRLKFRVFKHGAKGLIHKSRGRESNRKIDPQIIKKAKKYLKEKYYNFGPTFTTEKLDEIAEFKDMAFGLLDELDKLEYDVKKEDQMVSVNKKNLPFPPRAPPTSLKNAVKTPKKEIIIGERLAPLEHKDMEGVRDEMIKLSIQLKDLMET